nr:MAG TPA: hypothetical protein [Caudoviricetes sp.]
MLRLKLINIPSVLSTCPQIQPHPPLSSVAAGRALLLSVC